MPRCRNTSIDPGFLIPGRQPSTCSARLSLPTQYFCHSSMNHLSAFPFRRSKHFSPSVSAATVGSKGTPCRPGLLWRGFVSPGRGAHNSLLGKPLPSCPQTALPPHPHSSLGDPTCACGFKQLSTSNLYLQPRLLFLNARLHSQTWSNRRLEPNVSKHRIPNFLC